MDAKIYTYSIQILEKDLDFYGHVNNATYLVMYEQARWNLINKNGYGVNKIKETGKGPVILEIDIKYQRELKLHDEIVIESHMVSYENKIGRMKQSMKRGNDLCSIAEIVFGLFDLKERKLLLPTPEWMEAIGMQPSEKT